jgi:hypothetical protein
MQLLSTIFPEELLSMLTVEKDDVGGDVNARGDDDDDDDDNERGINGIKEGRHSSRASVWQKRILYAFLENAQRLRK